MLQVVVAASAAIELYVEFMNYLNDSPLSRTLWVTENVFPVSRGTVQLIGSGDLQNCAYIYNKYIRGWVRLKKYVRGCVS